MALLSLDGPQRLRPRLPCAWHCTICNFFLLMWRKVVTQPSHALRHAAELTDLVRVHFSEDGHSSVQPIAVVISDGGADHCVTWISEGCLYHHISCIRLRYACVC